MTPDPAPLLVVLRHHGLGDLVTVQPALRALRRRFPEHRMIVTCPSWLTALARHFGVVDRWLSETHSGTPDGAPSIDPSNHREVDNGICSAVIREVSAADVLVSLRTPGDELLPILDALHPRSFVSYRYDPIVATHRFPVLDFSDHILLRWQRLLNSISAHPINEDIYAVTMPDVPTDEHGFTLVHVGAGSPARLWPVERWSAVIRYLESTGHRVLLTGSPAESPRIREVCARTGLPEERDASGTDIMKLCRLVARARLVLCVDTGISHLATAFRRPAVTLFGPVSPAWWGPPPGNPQHRTIWAGRLGDTYATEVDEGLLRIGVDSVLTAIRESEEARR